MAKNSGRIVKYITLDGGERFGILYHHLQNSGMIKNSKAYVHLVNADFTPITEERDGETRQKSVLISVDRLTVMGFID